MLCLNHVGATFILFPASGIPSLPSLFWLFHLGPPIFLNLVLFDTYGQYALIKQRYGLTFFVASKYLEFAVQDSF
jgi:hypothetical protein